LIASRTATVRDGSAPAAAVRNGDPGTAAAWPTEVAEVAELAEPAGLAELAEPAGLAELAGGEASGVIIMYGISYMTWI
jgi:hypothetical protein